MVYWELIRHRAAFSANSLYTISVNLISFLGYLKLEYYIIYLQTFVDITKTFIDIFNKIVYIRYLYCFICWVLSTILKHTELPIVSPGGGFGMPSFLMFELVLVLGMHEICVTGR